MTSLASVLPAPHALTAAQRSEFRLLLEELCCDLCRFIHFAEGLPAADVTIDREAWLGAAGAFADIRVTLRGGSGYCVEVKHGYPDDTLVSHLARKYGGAIAAGPPARLVLVIDVAGRAGWDATRERIARGLAPGIALEVWDEQELARRLAECFGVRLDALAPDELLEVRQAIDRAKGRHAFGSEGGYEHDPLKAELLWHFGFWRLRELREAGARVPREMLPPGLYRNVAVIIADLCAFSSYMRDTPDAAIARESLTSFYSKARYQIINNGGMLYQFVGDEVVGLFGLPDHDERAAERAFETAAALASIGRSVAEYWQRHIDRIQEAAGLHIGIATGDVQIVSLRPYSRTHVGALGDCINMAARLMSRAGPGEIVASNTFYGRLGPSQRARFAEIDPLEAKNVGRIRGWKTRVECGAAP